MTDLAPGRELDKAVALAIGWSSPRIDRQDWQIPQCPPFKDYFNPPPQVEKWRSDWHWREPDSGACFLHPKQYSTDLNAAFEAAEKVGLFDYKTDWGGWNASWCVPCKVRHRITGEQNWRIQRHILGQAVFEWDTDEFPTPALAICAAILKLKDDSDANH